MKIASWNLKGGLSDGKRTSDIVEGITDINPDVMFFPEAFTPPKGCDDSTITELERTYKTYIFDYDDLNPNEGRAINEQGNHGFVALVRLAMSQNVECRVIKPGNHRNIVMADIIMENYPHLLVAGVHLDDRSDKTRMEMVRPLVEEEKPDIIIGDFNSMKPNTMAARIFGSGIMRIATEIIPLTVPYNLSRRLNEMAQSDVLPFLVDSGYIDADMKETPTIRPSVSPVLPRVVKLDHAMHKDLDGLDIVHKVHKDAHGSDHVPISVEINPKST